MEIIVIYIFFFNVFVQDNLTTQSCDLSSLSIALYRALKIEKKILQ